MQRHLPVVLLLASAVLLAGCGTTPDPTAEPTVAPTSTPTPTPTPTVDPAAVQPFGGACANALTIDDVDAVRPPSEFNGGPIQSVSAAIATSGGLQCNWPGDIGIALTAVPTQIASDAGRSIDPISTCGTLDWPVCVSSLVADGLWIEVGARFEGERDENEILAGLDLLAGTAAERVGDWAPARADSRPGSWTNPGCDAVLSVIDIGAIFHEVQSVIGRDGGGIVALEQLLVDAGRMTYCEWSETAYLPEYETFWIEVRVAPGAGGQPTTLAPRTVTTAEPSLTPFTVAGATGAVSWSDDSNYGGAVIEDGVNRVEVTVYGRDHAASQDLAAALFAQLSAAG